ncbi:Rib/alpha-like domain-containing protein, partial [Corynebacterium pseudogenitalium]
MEMKSFNRAARRRGTTIAAAALSVALVAPFVHPVVAPQSAAEAQAQTSGTVAATPVTDPSKLIEADGIANGYVTKRIDMTNAFGILSGVIGLKETTASTSLKGTMGINDATVYMQFKDVDGTISPTYTAKSHQLGSSAGNYAFDLRAKDEDGNLLSHPDSPVPGGEYSFIDANGKPHIFRAERGQEYRIWVDSPLKNEETGNDLTYVRQAGGGVPGAWAPVTQGTANGAFYFEGNNMQRTGVFLEERAPSVDEKSYMVSPEFSMDEEGWHKPGLGADVPRYSYFGRVWSDAEGGPDRNETGPLYKWDGDQPIEGAKVYASVLSDDGIAEYERLAIADKPYREQAAATKAMIENMRANGKEPILKTVGAETDAEGRYTIRMGEDIGDRIKNYTYIWAENDGKVLNSFSGFPTPVFQKVNGNAGENPNWGGDVGIPSHAKHRWYNINFAEVQADIANLDIVNYDSYLNPADLPEGINNLEPAKIKLTGALPFSGDNKIRWIGPDGKKIGEDCAVDTLADAANCSLAPEDFATPGTYVAQLVNAYDVVVGQDSFLALDKVRQNGEFEPQYEDATAPTGEKTTVEAPKDKDGKEIPEGTIFEPAGQVTDPEGNKTDKPEWITVNPDGTIEVEPPKGAKPGDYTIPVVVTYPDGSRETIEAKVNVKTSTPAPSITAGSEDDEVPADGSEKTLDDKVENPTDGMTGEVLDKDGNPIEDATVEVDPETGDIKVTVPEGTKPQDGTVVVKDKDGNKVGEVDVKITEPKDETPAPSITDGKEKDEVPADGSEKTLDDKVKNPTDDMTGEVLDKDGNPIEDATVEVDPETGDIKVTVPEGTKPQDGTVVVKDKDGNKVGEVDVKITEP